MKVLGVLYVVGYWIYLIKYTFDNFYKIDGFFDFGITMFWWVSRAILWPIWIFSEWF